MPIAFVREPLVECYMECDRLVRHYYATTKASEDVPPIDFNWPQYLALEHIKQIVLVTARWTRACRVRHVCRLTTSTSQDGRDGGM